MDNSRLLTLLEQFRSQREELTTVEFKVNWKKPGDIGEYISALGNAALLYGKPNAWLVWGVNDKTLDVIGTDFSPSKAKGEGKQSLEMWLIQKIKPRPNFQFHEAKHPNGKVVMLEIFSPRTSPLAFDGKRYIRIGSHKTLLAEHPDKEAIIWEKLGQITDWTGEVVPQATFDDLDPSALGFARDNFLQYLEKSEQDATRREQIKEEALSWDIATFLNKARVTKQGQITRSALILLGRDEASHFLAPSDVKISWILRNEQNQPLSGHHFGIPFILAPNALFKQIRNVTVEYMPDQSLFPFPVTQYDPWVIREALHNCIAHQDYRLGGKINVVEHPDKVVFTNLGSFIPQSIDWMLEHQSPPELYRNQWLVDGMIRLRMIDQLNSRIHRMFETQRNRLFPMPDYEIDTDSLEKPRVEVSISGKILDSNYTRALMKRRDLTLTQVVLLDKIQKRRPIPPEFLKMLKDKKLIEGRSPNYYIAAKVAEWTGQKEDYIRNRGLDDKYYQRLIVEFIQKYKSANREELDNLIIPKLSEVLSPDQKRNKMRNLIQDLRRKGIIQRTAGSKQNSRWFLIQNAPFAKTSTGSNG